MTQTNFSFGKNWQVFLQSITEERVKSAEQSLKDFFGLESFEGKSFLDVGCGSGLFSYAAYRLGAERVVSFDLDPLSVKCCEFLHNKAGKPSNWRVLEGSILDQDFVDQLGQFDVVYPWGVLHHTGNMWQAIKNAAATVAPRGYFYLALYNDEPGMFGSKFWFKVVKFYNHSPLVVKKLLENVYVVVFYLSQLARFRNPMKVIRKHEKKRGMSWRLDINDQLGGYPLEFARPDDVFNFVKTNFPDFNLLKMRAIIGQGNNKYLFKRG